MQAVTVGEIATEFAQKLFQADQYTDYLYYYGLSVQTAEAMAEWCHARIRKELGYGDQEPTTIREMLQQRYQGSRLVLAGRNKTTLAEGARCWVSGFRNSWPTYAAEY
jgi:cobalamin-dependent methionine synthase I